MPPPAILVIGAGQAGLAAGYHLRSTGLPFLIVDRAARPGEAWRQRYDSLTLFTPRRYSALPGMALPGDPDGFAGAAEFADYLARYAAHFALPLRLGSAVLHLRQDEDESFVAALASGETLEAGTVLGQSTSTAGRAARCSRHTGRQASRKPASSSVVSSLTRSSIRKAPTWAGSASPRRIIAMASAASSRVRLRRARLPRPRVRT